MIVKLDDASVVSIENNKSVILLYILYIHVHVYNNFSSMYSPFLKKFIVHSGVYQYGSF